ncbi:MAG: glycosyltransferase family 4 protein, partial [Pseudarcicella sp.]|nr:glycosyltransferase family 4 protein [Pseudarcicella sp.]
MLEKRYKIGFDAKRAFNNGTGLGNYSRFIIKALLEMAGSFDYFAFTPKVNPKFNFFLSEKNLQTRLPQISEFKFLWRSYFIVKELKKEGIDLFHGLSNELPYGLKKNNIKSVVTIHDLIFLHFPNHYPFIDRIIYRFKFKYAAQQADKVIAVSEQTKKDLVRFYDIAPSKIAVIYQDCDEAFKKIIPAQSILKTKEKYGIRQEYILCVGSIIERKNQLTLV